jgi:prepilin-type N-terminal cleavage/methylation domain-containing protein
MTVEANKLKMNFGDDGFTLVEIIAVLVILGILAVLAVPRYIDIEQNARQKTFNTALTEINAREFLTWSDSKISDSGYVSDAKIFGAMNYTVDPNFVWNAGDPTISGGTLDFKGQSFTLSRAASTNQIPAVWNQK